EDNPTWQKAAAMGAQIDPTNPLYGGAGGGGGGAIPEAPAAPSAKPDLDFDIAGQSQAAAPRPSFDLDLDSPKSSASHESSASSGLDFDINPASSAPVDVPAEPVKEEKSSFDFDLSGLEFPGGGAKTDDAEKTSMNAMHQTAALNLADLSLDAPGTDG